VEDEVATCCKLLVRREADIGFNAGLFIEFTKGTLNIGLFVFHMAFGERPFSTFALDKEDFSVRAHTDTSVYFAMSGNIA